MHLRRLAVPLVAVLALLVVPAATHAVGPCGPASLPSWTPCEEEVLAAEQAARAAAEQAPATVLEVKVRSHHGSSYREPGHTDITVRTTLDARVTFVGDHGAGTGRFRQ